MKEMINFNNEHIYEIRVNRSDLKVAAMIVSALKLVKRQQKFSGLNADVFSRRMAIVYCFKSLFIFG